MRRMQSGIAAAKGSQLRNGGNFPAGISDGLLGRGAGFFAANSGNFAFFSDWVHFGFLPGLVLSEIGEK